MVTTTVAGRNDEFTVFLTEKEPRLRRVLIARYGPEIGREAAAEALAYGWEHWEKLRKMRNPAGYLFRVGQSRARKYRTRSLALTHDPAAEAAEPWVEPGLAAALERLSPRQRSAVLMVHGFGHTYEETARAMGVTRATAQRHVERAMRRLRADLEVTDA